MEYKYAARMREKGAKKALKESGKGINLKIIHSLEGFEKRI